MKHLETRQNLSSGSSGSSGSSTDLGAKNLILWEDGVGAPPPVEDVTSARVPPRHVLLLGLQRQTTPSPRPTSFFQRGLAVCRQPKSKIL